MWPVVQLCGGLSGWQCLSVGGPAQASVQPRQRCSVRAMAWLGQWPSPLSCPACALQVVQVAKWHGRMIVRLLQPDKHAAWVDLQELAANAACITIVQVRSCSVKPACTAACAGSSHCISTCKHVHAAAQHVFVLGPAPQTASAAHTLSACLHCCTLLPADLPAGQQLADMPCCMYCLLTLRCRRHPFTSWPPKTPSRLSLTEEPCLHSTCVGPLMRPAAAPCHEAQFAGPHVACTCLLICGLPCRTLHRSLKRSRWRGQTCGRWPPTPLLLVDSQEPTDILVALATGTAVLCLSRGGLSQVPPCWRLVRTHPTHTLHTAFPQSICIGPTVACTSHLSSLLACSSPRSSPKPVRLACSALGSREGQLVLEAFSWRNPVPGRTWQRLRSSGTTAARLQLPRGKHLLRLLAPADRLQAVELRSRTAFQVAEAGKVSSLPKS